MVIRVLRIVLVVCDCPGMADGQIRKGVAVRWTPFRLISFPVVHSATARPQKRVAYPRENSVGALKTLDVHLRGTPPDADGVSRALYRSHAGRPEVLSMACVLILTSLELIPMPSAPRSTC